MWLFTYFFSVSMPPLLTLHMQGWIGGCRLRFLLFWNQLPVGVCQWETLERNLEERGEKTLSFWYSHSWLWGSKSHRFVSHFMFCFVLYFNPLCIWYCGLLTDPSTAVQYPCCWFSLSKPVSLFPVFNTLCQKCIIFLLSRLDLNRHSLWSWENILI